MSVRSTQVLRVVAGALGAGIWLLAAAAALSGSGVFFAAAAGNALAVVVADRWHRWQRGDRIFTVALLGGFGAGILWLGSGRAQMGDGYAVLVTAIVLASSSNTLWWAIRGYRDESQLKAVLPHVGVLVAVVLLAATLVGYVAYGARRPAPAVRADMPALNGMHIGTAVEAMAMSMPCQWRSDLAVPVQSCVTYYDSVSLHFARGALTLIGSIVWSARLGPADTLPADSLRLDVDRIWRARVTPMVGSLGAPDSTIETAVGPCTHRVSYWGPTPQRPWSAVAFLSRYHAADTSGARQGALRGGAYLYLPVAGLPGDVLGFMRALLGVPDPARRCPPLDMPQAATESGAAAPGEREGPIGLVNSAGRGGAYYVPAGADRRAVPLLVLLHGTNGSGEGAMSPFLSLARTRRFAIVAPDSRRAPNGEFLWEVGDRPDEITPDLTHVLNCIAWVRTHASLEVDVAHVLIAGVSSGGSSAPYIGSTSPLFTHVAVLHGGVHPEGLGPRRVPVWFSTADGDPVRAPALMQQSVDELTHLAFQTTFRTYHGGHPPGDLERLDLVNWWLGP